ncbi:hypothetical protein SDC9_122049 [bioreactor metagenome]|uniref:Uncharacterized protein n=1 Tax=bioreactor metagenome TaxID=1076179 RepID=A0A645CDT6_9ZZZZ
MLSLCVLFSVLGIRFYRRMSPRGRAAFLKVIAVFELVLELIKDFFLTAKGEFGLEYLPLHLCSLSILILLIDAWHPTSLSGDLLYCLTLPGALSGMLFPNWLDFPIYTFLSLHSFLFHTILVVYPLLRLCAGEISPNWRNLSKCFALLAGAAFPIYWFDQYFNLNYFFLNGGSPGSPLDPLVALMGDPGYILGLLLLVLFVWLALYLPWIIRKRR